MCVRRSRRGAWGSSSRSLKNRDRRSADVPSPNAGFPKRTRTGASIIPSRSIVDLQPLLDAPVTVQIHVATVVPAFFLGAWQLLVSRKGSPSHRLIGKVYLTLMSVTAAVAFFIPSFSSFSVGAGPIRLGLIHLFIPLTVHGVWRTLEGAPRRRHPRPPGIDAGPLHRRSDHRRATDLSAGADHVPHLLRLSRHRARRGHVAAIGLYKDGVEPLSDHSPFPPL